MTPPAGPDGAMARLRDIAPVLLPILAAFIVLGPYWTRGEIPVPGDRLRHEEPWKTHLQGKFDRPLNEHQGDPIYEFYVQELVNHQAYRANRLDLWEDGNFCGFPDLASAQSPRLNPLLHLLHRLFEDTADVWTAAILVHLLLAGTGFFVLCGRLGLSPWPSALGATAWTLNGYCHCWLEYQGLQYMMGWLPWILWLLDRSMQPRAWKFAMLAGVPAAMVLVSGHTQMALYVFIACGFFLPAFALAGRYGDGGGLRSIGRLAIMTTLAAGLAAPLVFSHLELASHSNRGGRLPFEEVVAAGSLFPENLLMHLVPDLFGTTRSGYFWTRPGSRNNYPESQMYAGVVTLLLVLAALGRGMTVLTRVALGLATLTLLMGMGTPVYRPFWMFVPGLDRLVAIRIIYIYEFFFVLLAAAGAEELLSRPERWERCRRMALALFILLGAGGLAATALVHSGLDLAALPPLKGRSPEKVAWYLGLLRRDYSITGSTLGLPVLYLALATAVLHLCRLPRGKRWAAPLLWICLVVDLASFSQRYNSWCPPELVLPPNRVVETLQAKEGPIRVAGIGSAAPANTLRPFGIDDVRGYVSVIPGWTYQLLEGINGRIGHPVGSHHLTLDRPDVRMLRAMSVDYLLTEDPLDVSGLELEVHQELAVHRVVDSLPRARIMTDWEVIPEADCLEKLLDPATDLSHSCLLLEDPGISSSPGRESEGATVVVTARLVQVTNDELEIEAVTTGPALLLLADTWYPGWEAEVDGVTEPVLRANLAFRAVVIRSAGSHRVRFRFRPLSFRMALAVSLLSLILLLAGLLWPSRVSSLKPVRESGDSV